MAQHPILFCYDGSPESGRALETASGMLTAGPAVVLTVWQPLSARLSESGGFGAFALEEEGDVDAQEATAAGETAQEGVERAAKLGFTASARSEEATTGVWRAIIDVAVEIDAALIVCGTRGRGSVRSALLGSTSHDVLAHAKRPVLISPDPHRAD